MTKQQLNNLRKNFSDKNNSQGTEKQNLLIMLIVVIIASVIMISSAYIYNELIRTAPPQTIKVARVGMILAKGGLGDRSFNDSAYEGLQNARSQYGIQFQIAVLTTDEKNLASYRNFAQQNYDLIIGIGYENLEYMKTVSKEYPNIKFAIIDEEIIQDNITSIIYREHEGDFIMGALAAMLTQTKKIGIIGGVDIPIIRRIESGFIQGVNFQDKSAAVLSNLAGTFTDIEVGKQIALKQYSEGIDIIYNAAGRTGLGIIDAAIETDKYTIGTSGNQIYLAPNNVIGNRPKRLDLIIVTLVKEIINNDFKSGTRSLGLKEEGISLGPFNEKFVTQSMIDYLNELKNKIISGEIVVETTI